MDWDSPEFKRNVSAEVDVTVGRAPCALTTSNIRTAHPSVRDGHAAMGAGKSAAHASWIMAGGKFGYSLEGIPTSGLLNSYENAKRTEAHAGALG